MSFECDPKWLDKIVFPQEEQMICPICGTVASNVKDIMECLYRMTSYKSRYIPDELVFTCSNEGCQRCDEDFVYSLSVVISAEFVNNVTNFT